MDVFTEAGFDALVTGLPATQLVDQWNSHVAKVGDKVFALVSLKDDAPRIVVKCTEESFEILTALEGIVQAPYFAKRKWVQIQAHSSLSQEDVTHYVRRSYEPVAAGLTRTMRQELGIALPLP
jgi:predicted DNA-binding protein (MmcQ/YjbR family)